MPPPSNPNPLFSPPLLALPPELRHQIYTHIVPHPILAYLGLKTHATNVLLPFFTVEPRSLGDDRSYIPSRMWDALDLRILLVCRLIYGELVEVLAERMGLDVTLLDLDYGGGRGRDGDGKGRGKGSEKGTEKGSEKRKGDGEGKTEDTMRTLVPAWFAQRVRTVRCYSDSENVKELLHRVFPSLKTVVLHDRIVRRLWGPEGVTSPSTSPTDIEKAAVMHSMRDTAVTLFDKQIAVFDAWVPQRTFRIVREVKFGRFRVFARPGPASLHRPSGWMLGHTFDVRVSENVRGSYSVRAVLAPSYLEVQKVAPEQCHWQDESGLS